MSSRVKPVTWIGLAVGTAILAVVVSWLLLSNRPGEPSRMVLSPEELATYRQADTLGERAQPPTSPSSGARAYPSQDEDMAKVDRICLETQAMEAPERDRPTAAETRALKDCVSTDDYYGVNGVRDPARARKCAFTELDGEPGPRGAGVLMMVYAKGEGVKPNYGFAKRMACVAGYAPYDTFTKLEEIEARERDGEGPVDICDDISSGWLGSQCAYLEARRRQLERDGRLAGLRKGWTGSRQAGWDTVLRRSGAYEEARLDNELDHSATLRGVYYMNDRERLRGFDETLLTQLVGGRVKGASSAAQADVRLNAVYKQVMAEGGEDAWPAREDVRKTQRAWLAYRDAWHGFARSEWPTQADAVVALVTNERSAALTCMLRNPPDTADCSKF